MEFPNVGSNCSEATCNKLDFLPVKCDGCKKLFCNNHMTYTSHNCPTPKRIDNQVPVCPLCNRPVASKRGETPDIAVNAHIERDCQSDPAKNRRKVFMKCSAKSCKNKEVVPIICDTCKLTYCVYHRHPADHKCNEVSKTSSSNDSNNHVPQNIDFSKIQGYMSEDEALAYALALSCAEESSNADNYQHNRATTSNSSVAESSDQDNYRRDNRPTTTNNNNCNLS